MRVLALVALLAACGDPATSVHLYVAMPESAGIDELAIVVESQRSLAPATTELTVLVPDDWSGTPVRLEVEGMVSSTVVALGFTDVMPERGAEVTAFVQLVSADCAVVCTPGDVRCEGDGVVTCEMVGACPQWSTPVACPSDAPFCSNGTCAATCSDECVANAASCDGTNAVRTCSNVDGDPCLEWTSSTCGTNEQCDNGACVTDDPYVCPSTTCSIDSAAATKVGGFASDAMYVYWTDTNGIHRRQESTGTVDIVVTRTIQTPGPIAVDASHVYWRDTSSRIARAPKTGGMVATVFNSTVADVQDFAVDGTYAYWTETSGKVRRRPKDGSGTIQDLTEAILTPGDIVVDDAYVYFQDYEENVSGHVFRVKKDGSGARMTVLDYTVWSLAVDDTHLYVVTSDLERVPKAGGSVEQLANTITGYEVAIDATHVIWSHNKTLMMRAKSGGPAIPLGNAGDGNGDTLHLSSRSVVWAMEMGVGVELAPRCVCEP